MLLWLSSVWIRLWPPGLLLWALMMRARKSRPLDFDVLLYMFFINSGLDRCNLHDPDAMRRQCGRRLRRSSPGVAATYVAQFTMLLQRRGAAGIALAVIEGHLGVEPGDYPGWGRGDTVVLAEKIKSRLEGVDFALACALVITWVNVCVHEESRGGYAADAVIRAFFGLSGDGGDSGQLVAQLGARLAGLDDVPTLMLVSGLAVCLIGLGRKTEAQALYRWFFDLRPSDLDSAPGIARRVRERLAGFRPEAFAMMVATVPIVLNPVISRDIVIGLVEDLYEITPDLYEVPERLAERLGLGQRIEPGAEADHTLSVALALNEALQFSRRFDKGRCVLRAMLADERGAPGEMPELLDRLPAFLDRLERHQRPSFLKMVMDNLFRSGEEAAAASVLEGRLRIGPEEYSAGAARLAARIRDARLGFSPEEETILVGQLFGVLVDTGGREGDALVLLDAYLWHVLDLSAVSVSRPVAVEMVCHLLRFWLELSPPDVAFSRCDAIVRFLRHCLDLRGVLLEDRSRFVRDLATMRRLIVQTGRDQSRRRPAVWLDVLCWDIELGQRLLIERYRFMDGDGASLDSRPEEGWLKGVKAGWSLRRDDVDEESDLGPTWSLAASCFGYVSDKNQEDSGQVERTRPNPGVSLAAEVLRAGVTPRQVAASIGAHGLLLRAGFLPDGRLYWDAFRSDGTSVARVAGRSGDDAKARDTIDRAVAWHDRFLAAVWGEQGRPERPIRDLARELREPVREIARRLSGGRGVPAPEPPALTRLAAQVVATCSQHEAEPWLVEWLRAAIPREWESALAAELPLLRASWRRNATLLDAVGEGHVERALNSITREFLSRVGDVVDLNRLGPFLGPDVDVVVEVEGPLHAVPVALLRVGESRLSDIVRSVRSSLTLLIDLLKTRDAARPDEAEGPARLVTVSWFEEHDPAAAGAFWLHHGQARLARRHGLIWESAGDDPPGQAGAIRNALEGAGAVRILTVCGHGQLHGPGVRLQGDVTWNGRACDFSKVDWLMLVSCSLGRVRHAPGDPAGDGDGSEAPDVEGFIANLVARRVRSVLACRWPVHGHEAAGFANLVASEYLDLVGTAPGGLPSRSLALNRARNHALGRPGMAGPGLNTVAAFEIYGLG